MAIDTTIIDKVTGYANVQDANNAYRVVRVLLPNIANVIGSGAGAAVTTAIAFPGLPINGNYIVNVTPNQDAVPYVSSKTTSGFNVVLSPRLAANTLAVGTFDVEIVFDKPNS